MTNDSSTGGYLLPSTPTVQNPPILEDAVFDTFIQNLVVGITGLPGNLIFPRWQVTPPNLPSITTNWAAIGVQEEQADTFVYEAHNPVTPGAPFPPAPNPPVTPPANGYDVQIYHEVVTILCSFYGPNARSYAKLLRDGLAVAQNREVLQLAGMGLVSVGKVLAVPSIVNTQWYYRVDLPVVIRREIVRNYPILNIVSSQITITSDRGATVTINP